LGVLLFSSTLTITADKITRTLQLEYRSLVQHNIKQINFGDIANVHVERNVSRNKGRTSYTYRVAITQRDGKIVPLRSYYSSGSDGKQRLAGQLRDFMGLAGQEADPGRLPGSVQQIVQSAYEDQQQALSGPENEMQERNGVHWKIQTVAMGATPMTRWFSPDFTTPGSFLFVAQKVRGQGGLLASLGSMLFKQAVAMYGFGPGDTPGLDQAGALTPMDPKLEADFMAFTNDPTAARQTLNPWAMLPLAAWAQRYPLNQLQTGGRFSQLVVLFGPNGVYLATLNLLGRDQVDELNELGIELVKSQGVSAKPAAGGIW